MFITVRIPALKWGTHCTECEIFTGSKPNTLCDYHKDERGWHRARPPWSSKELEEEARAEHAEQAKGK